MMVEDSKGEGNEENIAPIPIPAPGVIIHSLILIEEPTPVVLAEEVDAEGEDDTWYIPPVYCHRIHPLDKYFSARVDPVPDYVEILAEDPLAGPHQDDPLADGSEDEMWVNLGVLGCTR